MARNVELQPIPAEPPVSATSCVGGRYHNGAAWREQLSARGEGRDRIVDMLKDVMQGDDVVATCIGEQILDGTDARLETMDLFRDIHRLRIRVNPCHAPAAITHRSEVRAVATANVEKPPWRNPWRKLTYPTHAPNRDAFTRSTKPGGPATLCV